MKEKKDSKRKLFEKLHSGNYKVCYKTAKKLTENLAKKDPKCQL